MKDRSKAYYTKVRDVLGFIPEINTPATNAINVLESKEFTSTRPRLGIFGLGSNPASKAARDALIADLKDIQNKYHQKYTKLVFNKNGDFREPLDKKEQKVIQKVEKDMAWEVFKLLNDRQYESGTGHYMRALREVRRLFVAEGLDYLPGATLLGAARKHRLGYKDYLIFSASMNKEDLEAEAAKDAEADKEWEIIKTEDVPEPSVSPSDTGIQLQEMHGKEVGGELVRSDAFTL